jgi:hypothetical protein
MRGAGSAFRKDGVNAPPHVRLRSANLTRRHAQGAGRIVAAWDSRIERAGDAVLQLGGELFLGYWPSGPPRKGPAVLEMGTSSSLNATGWSILASGSHTILGPRARMTLADGVVISVDTRIVCMESVQIGADTLISWDVTILDTHQHSFRYDGEMHGPHAAVWIGEHVLVGAGARVMPGVTIADGAVIGAGAVVTQDVPAGAMVAGSPARVIRRDVEWW